MFIKGKNIGQRQQAYWPIQAFKYPARTKGDPQIAVSFEIDADGIINVSATDKTPYPKDLEHYGKPNTVAIQVTEVGLTDAEVEKMIQESNGTRKPTRKRKGCMNMLLVQKFYVQIRRPH